MIKIILDKEALEHGYVSLYSDSDVEIDESLSNEILARTPCYDLAVSSKGELIELECDIEDLDKIEPHLFSGRYEFEGEIVDFKELLDTIKDNVQIAKSNLQKQVK